MKNLLITVVSLAVAASQLVAQDVSQKSLSSAENEVRKLEREWLDAYEKHDSAAMDRIVADDFTITFPGGQIQTKAQIMAMVKQPQRDGAPATRFHTEDVQSRAYGDVVILIGRVIDETETGGATKRGESRYTDTYVRRDGRWQVVASHLSNVPAAKPNK